MPKYRVPLTRDCTFTQTCVVEIEAKDAAHAEMLAESLLQDDLANVGPIIGAHPTLGNPAVISAWTDDDSFHHGEDSGMYVADPSTVREVTDDDYDRPEDACSNPGGHVWNRSAGEADEARISVDYANDNIRCVYCGADGDA